MNAAEMREFLKNEYGISSIEELEKAIEESAGIDIGMFTQPLIGGENDKEANESTAA